MGTNYYLYTKPCQCCGRTDEPLHIGKSSAGWTFLLREYRDADEHSRIRCEEISTLETWQQVWSMPEVEIRDEYGRPISSDEMLSIVTERGFPSAPNWTREMYAQNLSELGPKNLIRRKTDPRWDVRQGPKEATYDWCGSEFS